LRQLPVPAGGSARRSGARLIEKTVEPLLHESATPLSDRLTRHSQLVKLSTDPLFIEKVRDIVGLYLNPPTSFRRAKSGSSSSSAW